MVSVALAFLYCITAGTSAGSLYLGVGAPLSYLKASVLSFTAPSPKLGTT